MSWWWLLVGVLLKGDRVEAARERTVCQDFLEAKQGLMRENITQTVAPLRNLLISFIFNLLFLFYCCVYTTMEKYYLKELEYECYIVNVHNCMYKWVH